MDILILGGTIFLGRHLTEIALSRGHRVTLFNRGQHNPDLFAGVEKLRGNRDGDLDALKGRHWDAVIDTCGYIPRHVRASAELLAESVEHYTFISSISVYQDFSKVGLSEDDPVATLSDPNIDDISAVDNDTYGPLKALCEQAAEMSMPGRVLSVRPGLIVGPHDPTQRFTYWPRRVSQGGTVLSPGNPQAYVQIIDARDLAGWILNMVEIQRIGVYNATGPTFPLNMEKLLQTCREVSHSQAEFMWVSDEFLTENRVSPWTDLPLWLPEGEDTQGFSQVNCTPALNQGLSFSPLSQTIYDTLVWDQGLPPEKKQSQALSPQREADLLARWQARQTADAAPVDGLE